MIRPQDANKANPFVDEILINRTKLCLSSSSLSRYGRSRVGTLREFKLIVCMQGITCQLLEEIQLLQQALVLVCF